MPLNASAALECQSPSAPWLRPPSGSPSERSDDPPPQTTNKAAQCRDGGRGTGPSRSRDSHTRPLLLGRTLAERGRSWPLPPGAPGPSYLSAPPCYEPGAGGPGARGELIHIRASEPQSLRAAPALWNTAGRSLWGQDTTAPTHTTHYNTTTTQLLNYNTTTTQLLNYNTPP